VKRLVVGLALATPIVAAPSLGAGCASIVDLGPEATLREAAVADDGPPGDDEPTVHETGPAPEASFPCGVTPDPNPKCNACAVQNCCSLGKQCAADPMCVQGIQCSLDCVFDSTCVEQCLATYATDGGVLVPYQTCAISNCESACLPGPICAALARCCLTIQDQSARELCAAAVNTADESGCVSIVTNVLRPQLGQSFCPAIGDAGAGDAN
jgi:hypothetical protein